MTIVQNMHHTHCSSWIPSIILQKCNAIPFSQEIKKNTTKSSTMDYGGFSYLTYMRSRGNHWTHSHTLPHWQTQWKTPIESSISTKKSHPQFTFRWSILKESNILLTHSLRNLMSKQHLKLKSSIVDFNNSLFPSFDNLYKELSASFWLVDSFSDHFSFYTMNHKNKDIYHSFVTVICNIILTLNHKCKNKKINRK